jgi:membrane-bound metal-dependent hydrolase YbcI (DUF457 family)
MFIGHFAVGFAAKRASPGTSLGPLIAAPLLLDLIWPVCLLAGWEQVEIAPGDTKFTPLRFISYPISHSLLMAVVWGLLFAAVFWLLSRSRRAALIIAAGVVSHWVFDWITHRPDLLLVPGGTSHFGLSLWNNVPATLITELVLLGAGLWLYSSTTRPSDGIGKYGYWLFALLLLAIYLANMTASPPPSVRAIAWTALGLWLFPWLAGWIDHHRENWSSIGTR